MKIQESAENYLESILMLYNQKGYVRSIDIAHQLAVTKPSVSNAMKNLRESGYITMQADGHIHLTDTGREIAERVYERHRFLQQALLALGVSAENALADACRIEHVISQETFDALKARFDPWKKREK